MTVPAAPPDGVRQRLDVRTIASRVLTLAALRRQWGLVVGMVAVFGLQGGFRTAGLAAALVAVLLLSAASAVVEWVRTTYAIEDGRLVVERGLLRRSLTVVPLDRVRGVDVHASALQRLLGIASVRVDAAATGGRDDEAVLDAVSADEARALRDVLLRQAAAARSAARPGSAAPPGTAPAPPGPPGPGGAAGTAAPGDTLDPGSGRDAGGAAAPGAEAGWSAEEPGVVLARFRPRWLWYAPLVGGYLLAPLAALGAAAQLLDDFRIQVSEERLTAVLDGRPVALAAALAALALLLLAVVGAVVTAAVANWGFTLTRRGGTLVAERGLLSRRQVSLEHDRIRGYALAEPLPLRAAGGARLTALVTGLGGDDGEGLRGRRGQLLPLGPATVAREVAAAAVLPFRTPLRRHPPAARRRRLVRAVVPWLLLAGGLAAAGRWPAAAGALLLAALGVSLGLDRYEGLGHALDERAVSVRSGSLRRRQVVLQRRGVVGWTVRQSLSQRFAGLATVTVATGAGSGGYDAVDIGAEDGVRLMAEVDPRRVGPLVGEPAGGPRPVGPEPAARRPAAGAERADPAGRRPEPSGPGSARREPAAGPRRPPLP